MSRETSVTKLNTLQKDFYSFLGLLSIKFAKMDYNLNLILSKLINPDDDLIAFTLIERNNISQTIELLEKINLIRGFEEKHLKNLLTLIKQVKTDRNLFIHGLWKEPYNSENDIVILCEERKIKYKEEKGVGRNWQYNSHKKFRLSDIKRRIIQIDDIIYVQESLIKKLEDFKFN
jgi:hypothetical protein